MTTGKVRIRQDQLAIGSVLVHSVEHRMGVPQEDNTARPKEVSDHLRPPGQVWNPRKHTDARVDDFEPAAARRDACTTSLSTNVARS